MKKRVLNPSSVYINTVIVWLVISGVLTLVAPFLNLSFTTMLGIIGSILVVLPVVMTLTWLINLYYTVPYGSEGYYVVKGGKTYYH